MEPVSSLKMMHRLPPRANETTAPPDPRPRIPDEESPFIDIKS